MSYEVSMNKCYEKKVSCTFNAEELAEFGKKAFLKVKKGASIKGFRKGKAPEAMIKQIYGRDIELETREMCINDAYGKFLTETKTYPLSQAKIENEAYKANENYSFDIIIEVYPEFDLKEYTGMQFEEKIVSVEDSEIEENLKKIQNDYATVKPLPESEIVNGSIVEIEIKPKTLADAKWETQTIVVGEKSNEDIDKNLLGMKKGEEKDILFGNDDNKQEVQVRIKEVSEKILPELNDEFVKTIDAKYETLEALKDELKEGILKQKTTQAENQLLGKIMQKLIEIHEDLDIPPTMLNSYLNDMVEGAMKQFGQAGIDKEVMRNIYKETALNNLKQQFIAQKIIEAEKLSVAEEEIENFYKETAEKSKIDIAKVRKYYGKKEKKDGIVTQLLDNKFRKLLKEKNNIVMVEKLAEEIEAEKKAKEENAKEKKTTEKPKTEKKAPKKVAKKTTKAKSTKKEDK